uniref:Protocadherin n=1 Tax=Octopus vulgaris TaxID=6645 RepID=A0A411DZ41_OCTVU|nr:protocadherin [Octopus vulgaris]
MCNNMSVKFISFSLIFWGLQLFASALRELNFHVLEETAEGTYVGNVAKAFTRPTHGDYLFKFLTQGNQYTNLFHIGTNSGIITTAVPIDREHICDNDMGGHTCIVTVSVAVQSSSDPRFLDMMNIKINIDDINDNAPLFDKDEIALEISESTPANTKFPIEDAYDLDTGIDNSIKYYILLNDRDKFTLLQENGFLDGLQLKQKLDHEEQDFYQLVIVAKDNGTPQRSGNVVVNITVLDANDNAPKFDKKSYTVYIHENRSILSTILTLHAEDLDSGPNGQVGYKLHHRTSSKIKEIFDVNQTTGEIHLISRVDYEDRPRYSFNVIAYDHGAIVQSSTASVNVYVVDVNDNKPEIIINLLSLGYAANVSESASKGKFIAHVSINDRDQDQNGNVSCSVNDHHFSLQIFSIKTYKVVVAKPLDFEKTSVHNVSIRCHDHGTPQLHSEKSFLVIVADKNDNPPVFEQTLIKTPITENNNFHDYVTKVTAKDNDTGINSEIHYELHHDAHSWFNIDHRTGVITANKQFDREQNAEIKFRVLAIDSGSPPLTGTATVHLNILDINDEAPQFKSGYYKFHVKEDQEPFTYIGRVDAQDLDHGENGRIRYWISKNYEAPQLFMVTDGVLKTKARLSRMKDQRYDFLVVAADHGKKPLSSSASVTVIVDDVNDNYPYIIYPSDTNNTISVIYDMTPVDRPISRVVALDDDEGENAMLSYFLKSTPETAGLFRINHTSGEIMLIKDSDIRIFSKSYKLPIVVKDHGKPPKSTSAILIVMMILSNSTELPYGNSTPDGERNLTIVIVLAAVTVVLATCIVITICIIKKVDQNRRRYPAKMHEDARRKSDSSPDSDRQKHKKEVSFSLDGADPTSKGSANSLASNTTVKNPGAFFAPDLPSLQRNQIGGGDSLLHSPGGDSIISNGRHLGTFTGRKNHSNLPSPATSSLVSYAPMEDQNDLGLNSCTTTITTVSENNTANNGAPNTTNITTTNNYNTSTNTVNTSNLSTPTNTTSTTPLTPTTDKNVPNFATPGSPATSTTTTPNVTNLKENSVRATNVANGPKEGKAANPAGSADIDDFHGSHAELQQLATLTKQLSKEFSEFKRLQQLYEAVMLKAEFMKLLEELKVLSVASDFPEEDGKTENFESKQFAFSHATPIYSSVMTTTSALDDDTDHFEHYQSVGSQMYTTTKLTPASASVQPVSTKQLSLHHS